MKIYENSCRVCLANAELSNDKKTKWISIEEKDSDDVTICDKITICTGININRETLLAKSICQPCTEHLRSAFDFQKNCKQSDIILQDYIQKNICTSTTKLKTEDTDDEIVCFPDVKVEINSSSSSSDQDADSDFQCDNSILNDTEEEYKPIKKYKQKPITRKRSNNSDKCKTLVPTQKLPRSSKLTNSSNKDEENLVNDSTSDSKPIEERKKRKKSKKYENEPFICELCGNVYKKKSLTTHMRWHRGKKEFQCEICKKDFLLANYLAKHMKIHIGIKNFQCSFCTRTFYTNGHKNAHEKVHTGERKYSCKFCDRSFTQSQTLKRHMLIHSGVKPYKCHDCGKEFRQSNHLKKHFSTKTNTCSPK